MSEDIYGLGNCATCNHKAHNHGLGGCFGALICLCKKFNGAGYENALFLVSIKEGKE